jgi:GTP-binding protein Era
MKKLKTGYVGIIGKPNAGKSTLINTIMKRKVSITSYKPQTTRKQITALYNDSSSSIIFIDTPGFHIPHNEFDKFMNKEVKSVYKTVDCLLYLFDPTKEFDEEDDELIKSINDFNVKNIILVLSKQDISSTKKNQYSIGVLKQKISFDEVVEVSSMKNENIDKLLTLIKTKLPLGDKAFSKIEDDDNFVITEIIREQIIFNTKKEVPYSVYVEIEQKKFEDNIFHISAVINVEKESQKPILIGKGGQMIKKIGVLSRKELLNIYDCKINLKLFVKTTPN